MNGRPERAQTNVRLVRRAQPGATRPRALPLTATIVVITVFVAAVSTRATGSGATLIGPIDPPAVSVPDAPSPGSAGPSAKGTSSAPRAHIGCAGPVLVARRNDAAAARLPVRRRAGRPRGLRRLAAHDRRYDEPAAEGLRAAGPRGVSRAGLSGGGSIRRIAIADLKALVKDGRKAGVRLAVESAYRSEARQRRTFAGWVRTSGEAEARRFSARAGHSEHQLGTAIDFKAAGGGSPWTQAFARSRMRDGWRPTPGGSAGSRAIRGVQNPDVLRR
jgi:hypothetical protein